MTASLRPMSKDEFPSFREASETGYAEDMVRNGGFPEDAARAKAQRDFESLLPAGLDSPGQTLLVVEDDALGAVGHIWFAERELEGGRSAYLYDVAIDEGHRRRGLGRQAMLLLEEEVRKCGLNRVALNVFGGNDVARRLYRSLGYEEVAVSMAKELVS